jgi:hypothetical protein
VELYLHSTNTPSWRGVKLKHRDNLRMFVRVTGSWRKLQDEKPHNLYSSPNVVKLFKSRRMRWVGHVARMREMRNAPKILVEKPERERPLGKQRRRWAG